MSTPSSRSRKCCGRAGTGCGCSRRRTSRPASGEPASSSRRSVRPATSSACCNGPSSGTRAKAHASYSTSCSLACAMRSPPRRRSRPGRRWRTARRFSLMPSKPALHLASGLLISPFRDQLPAILPAGTMPVQYVPFSALPPRLRGLVEHDGRRQASVRRRWQPVFRNWW